MAVGVETRRTGSRSTRPAHQPGRLGGFHGDRATIGCVVNAIPFIVHAPPGLHKVVTLPLFGLVPLH